MTQAPHVIRGLRSGLKLGQGALTDSLMEGLTDSYCGCAMAQTAENCAAKYGISREEQDRYALRSQQLADRAWTEGRFADEVVPVEVATRKGRELVSRDDHLRPNTTLEGLAKLTPVFKRDGTVTAGNASGIVDGGAALVMASADAVSRYGLVSDRSSDRLGVGRRRTGADGNGPGACDATGARAHRADAVGHRPHRDQRGIRRTISRCREGARPGPGRGQCQRRCHCTRPSARDVGNASAPDRPARTASPRPATWSCGGAASAAGRALPRSSKRTVTGSAGRAHR